MIDKINFDCIPSYVQTVLRVLSGAGGNPYIVGGAVRDLLTGQEPHDYDIACDLMPDEIMKALAKK